MESLTIRELCSREEAHHRAVAATVGIDHFCSSLDWILPAHKAFIPDHPLYLRACDEGFISLARGFNPRIGRYLQPLEASWCLACPFVGGDTPRLVEAFAEDCREESSTWDLLYLPGIPRHSPLFEAIIRAFHRGHRVGIGHQTRRYVASLEGGIEGYLSRRSSKFRHNLRRGRRLAQAEGVTFEWLSSASGDSATASIDDAIYDRILALEERSWKGRSGTGILDGGMNAFYRSMLPRLIRRGALRVLFARADERDIAFVFGGIFGDTYRGLQLSYDHDYGHLSPGNLVQFEIIDRLCDEGVGWYDLGSELDYKARWAEDRLETITLWVWNDA